MKIRTAVAAVLLLALGAPVAGTAQAPDSTRLTDLQWLVGAWLPQEDWNRFSECFSLEGRPDSLAMVWVSVDDRPDSYVIDGAARLAQQAQQPLEMTDLRFTEGDPTLQQLVFDTPALSVQGAPLAIEFVRPQVVRFRATCSWFYEYVQLHRVANNLYITYWVKHPTADYYERTTYAYYHCDCD